MKTFNIRTAQDADCDALMDLYEEFHAFHVDGVPEWLRLPDLSDAQARGQERARLRDLLQALVRNLSAALLCAEVDGQIVGLAEVYLRHDEPHPLTRHYTYGHLQSLIVTARWRRCGVGRQLTAAVEAWTRDHGGTQLRLGAWEFTRGPLPFYEALGYRTVKRELVKPLA